jgi:hypothetical protein
MVLAHNLGILVRNPFIAINENWKPNACYCCVSARQVGIKFQIKRVSLYIMARKDKDEIIASKSLIILINCLIMLSLTLLTYQPVNLIFGQEETNQTGQQGESSSSSKEQSQQQEKIRCSNGSIVDTASECPLSDICPPTPQLGNGTLECSSNSLAIDEATNNVSKTEETLLNEVGNQGQHQAIDITTDKSTYVPGEVVNITISNIGTEPLTFPNAALGLRIENSKTHEKYPLLSAQVITTLDSGGKKSLNWDQIDSSGKNVRPGNYTATTSTGSLNANVTFAIS